MNIDELRRKIAVQKEIIQGIEEDKMSAGEELDCLEEALAPLVCPFKVGDTVYAWGNNPRVIKEIRKHDRWDYSNNEFSVYGARVKKNGELYSECKLISGATRVKEGNMAGARLITDKTRLEIKWGVIWKTK